MRSFPPLTLITADPDRCLGFAQLLQRWGWPVALERPSALALSDPAPGARTLLLDMTEPGGHLADARLQPAASGRPVARAALVRGGDPLALSRALALGLDDALVLPAEESELVNRLACLADLARMRAERARRSGLLSPLAPRAPTVVRRRGGPDPSRATPESAIGSEPSIVLIGPAEPLQVQIVETLGRCSVRYVEPARAAMAPELGQELLTILTDPEVARRGLRAAGPVLLVSGALELDAAALRRNGIVDRLDPAASPELRALRLRFWRRMAALRRALRAGPLEAAALATRSAAACGLTGLFGRAFLIDYLTARLRELTGSARLGLIVLHPLGLEPLNGRAGWLAGNRLIAAAGAALRRHCRAEDLAGHLGGGRFAVVADGVLEQDLASLGMRLARELGDAVIAAGLSRSDAPFAVAVQALRAGEDAARLLGRARREARFAAPVPPSVGAAASAQGGYGKAQIPDGRDQIVLELEDDAGSRRLAQIAPDDLALAAG